jgi:hypothetical protein
LTRRGWVAVARAIAVAAWGATFGCRTPPVPSGSTSSATAASAAPSVPNEAARDASRDAPAAPLSDAAPSPPRSGTFATARLLDAAKARAAVTGYKRWLAHFCGQLADAGDDADALLEDVGLPSDAPPNVLCAGVPPKALAAGSFVDADADEVLLEVRSGEDEAAGDSALALMRADTSGYRLVRHVYVGSAVTAKVRVTTPSGRDVLLMCSASGHQGLYRDVCGFLGQGSFREHAGEDDGGPGHDDELTLVAAVACGPAAVVELGKIALQGQRLEVGLTVVRSVRKPAGPDEGRGGLCSKDTNRREKRFTVAYEIAADPGDASTARVHLVTPIPQEVADVAAMY